MKKKNCSNCLWADKCPETQGVNIKDTQICEGYDPVYGNGTAYNEYKRDLQERAEEYQKVIDEQNS